MKSNTDERDQVAAKTLGIIDSILRQHDLVYWLEAGTALAAYRDGKILPWEHDIDLAIWRSDLAKLWLVLGELERRGCRISIQKGLPLVDNIIQVYLPETFEGVSPVPNQIDFYLYTLKDSYAYMRWLQKPEGFLKDLRQKTFIFFRNLLGTSTGRFSFLNRWLPGPFRRALFRLYLQFHVRVSSCIFHCFPASFFKNLRFIDFYGVQVRIAEDTEAYLEYRYGSGWRTPDSQFNQAGKWKQSKARVLLPMRTVPLPEIDFSLFDRGYFL